MREEKANRNTLAVLERLTELQRKSTITAYALQQDAKKHKQQQEAERQKIDSLKEENAIAKNYNDSPTIEDRVD